MLGLGKKKKSAGGTFALRVSDVVDVPLRGTLLRLRVVEGTPSMTELTIGSQLRLRAPTGVERDVRIDAYAVTGGRATQERLDRTGELDVVVSDVAAGGADPIEIGWLARRPQDRM